MRHVYALLALVSCIASSATAQVETTLLRDVRPGSESSAPWRVGSIGDTLLFMADGDGLLGPEVWATNGREAWLVLTPPDTLIGQPHALGVLDGDLFLLVGGVIWRTDGVTADTVRVGLTSEPQFSRCANRFPAAVLSGRIVFAAGAECALWAVNQDSSWAVIDPFAPNGPGAGVAQHLIARGGFAYIFWGYDAMSGRRVLRTTGDPGNMLPVMDPEASTTPSPWEMVVLYGGSFYYESGQNNAGDELWRWDVSSPPTMVADLAPGSASSTPRAGFVAFDQLFFLATNNATGRELRMYDGSTVTTPFELAAGAGPAADVAQLGHRAIAGSLYFWVRAGIDGNDRFTLHTWDGTTLRVVSTGLSTSDFHEAGHLVGAAGRVWFDGCDLAGAHGASLWQTDGITASVAIGGSPDVCTGARPFMAMIEADGGLVARVQDPSVGIEPFLVRPQGTVDVPDAPAGELALLVGPNPMVGQGWVTVTLPIASDLRVELFDLLGRRAATLFQGRLPAGRTTLVVPPLTSGTYLVRAGTARASMTVID